MIETEVILKIIGLISAFVAGVFAIRKLYQWVYPIKIVTSVSYPFEDCERGKIGANVTNNSSEAIYITRCDARGIYSRQHIILKHLRHPFVRPRLYKTIWYGATVFSMVAEEACKIDAYEPKKFEHRLSNHPLSFFTTPFFVVQVELSSGRVFHSGRLKVPKLWHVNARGK